jgi:hypothetical protein
MTDGLFASRIPKGFVEDLWDMHPIRENISRQFLKSGQQISSFPIYVNGFFKIHIRGVVLSMKAPYGSQRRLLRRSIL